MSQRTLFSVIVRFGRTHSVGEFRTSIADLRAGEAVLVRTERGMELGEVVSGSQETERDRKFLGTALRRINDQDEGRVRRIQEELEPSAFEFCNQKIAELELPMKLIAVEHLFGGDKIIFYFVSETRVDFRELVKALASKYHTRIEMRQIGVRDEARLLGTIGHCGLELCCRKHLKDLEAVNMRMAKMQKTTLDPVKISGLCGRLMCCLRFEDQLYQELASRLPPRGKRIRTPRGEGIVISHDILQQKVRVKTEHGTEVEVKLEDITEE